MKLRFDALTRTLERSARRRRERAFDAVPTQVAYDRWASVYDDQDNPLIALEEREFPHLIGDVTGLEALDVGCGTGRWTARLAGDGARVTAVDFSAGMLERARQRVDSRDVHFVEHDIAGALPFAADRFDLVLSALVLEHVGNLGALCAELARTCKPGGRVALSAMHPAMMLLGSQAEFSDPATGRDVRPTSHPHQISDFVMAMIGAGLTLEHASEHEVDDLLEAQSPVAAKFAGWPLLALLIGKKPGPEPQ